MKALKDQARRGFTILVAVMLLTVVVVPAFSGSAAAATEDDHCTQTAFTQLVGNVCEWANNPDTVNNSDSRDAAYVQADHHAELRGEFESAEQIRTIFDNYAQDTGTIASLEARNAIATAYQNNKSASTADAKAQTAIQEYYSKKEVNTLEAFSKQQIQLAYSANSTRNHPDAHNKFQYPQADVTDADTLNEIYYTGGTKTRNYTLSNGSVHQYEVAVFYVSIYDAGGSVTMTGTYAPKIQNWQGTDTYQAEYPEASNGVLYLNGLSNVRASYVGTSFDISNGHPAQVILDRNSWAATLTKWQTQSDTVESNYAVGTASDLYTAMDDGRLDPADVRGAEGQVRYLSGDSNATSQRYKAALYGTLNMEQAGFNSTFYVDYTGYTKANYNRTTDGNRTVDYSGYVENQSYEGMVFSSEIPSGGFQPGETYNTSDLNGTTMIYSQESGSVTFVKGNLTIRKVTNNEGEQMDSVSWEKPKYSTNDVSEYIDYLNQTQQMQMQLLEFYSEDTSSGSTTSDTSSGWNPTQNQMIAAFIAIVAMLGMAQRGAE